MNDKEQALYKVVDAVVECCSTKIGDTQSVTREDVLGSSRKENVVMTRAILVGQLVGSGYSVSTIAQILNRTPHAVRHLIDVGYSYIMTSRAYRLANAQATMKCEEIWIGV